jgi:hypothetical protein
MLFHRILYSLWSPGYPLHLSLILRCGLLAPLFDIHPLTGLNQIINCIMLYLTGPFFKSRVCIQSQIFGLFFLITPIINPFSHWDPENTQLGDQGISTCSPFRWSPDPNKRNYRSSCVYKPGFNRTTFLLSCVARLEG